LRELDYGASVSSVSAGLFTNPVAYLSHADRGHYNFQAEAVWEPLLSRSVRPRPAMDGKTNLQTVAVEEFDAPELVGAAARKARKLRQELRAASERCRQVAGDEGRVLRLAQAAAARRAGDEGRAQRVAQAVAARRSAPSTLTPGTESSEGADASRQLQQQQYNEGGEELSTVREETSSEMGQALATEDEKIVREGNEVAEESRVVIELVDQRRQVASEKKRHAAQVQTHEPQKPVSDDLILEPTMDITDDGVTEHSKIVNKRNRRISQRRVQEDSCSSDTGSQSANGIKTIDEHGDDEVQFIKPTVVRRVVDVAISKDVDRAAAVNRAIEKEHEESVRAWEMRQHAIRQRMVQWAKEGQPPEKPPKKHKEKKKKRKHSRSRSSPSCSGSNCPWSGSSPVKGHPDVDG